MQWAIATFTLQPVVPQRFCLVRDQQIFRYGSSLTGLRHGQLFAVGMNFDQQGPVTYLSPWEEEEELPVFTRSDWGGPLNAGPGGQRPHQLPAGIASASAGPTAPTVEATAVPAVPIRVMETCEAACQTPVSLTPNDTSLLAWEAATHQLGEALRLLRRIAGHQAHSDVTHSALGPAVPSNEPAPEAASASSTIRSTGASGRPVGIWIFAGIVGAYRPVLWTTLLLSAYCMSTDANPMDTDTPSLPAQARTVHHASVHGGVPDFAIPTYGNCLSLAVRQAVPSQYGFLQAHLSPTWQAWQAGRITLLPECPARTAVRFHIYHPGCLRRPVTGRLLMSPDCLRVLLVVCSQWATREGLAPVVPVHPQPDRSAVHLITSAPHEDQVHVLLWSPRLSVPSVLPRSVVAGELAAFSMGNQTGTVLPPVGAAHAGEFALRDGDCLPFWAAERVAANSRASGAWLGRFVMLWLAALSLQSETGTLSAAIMATLMTHAKAMQVATALPEFPLYMSCHMHGNTRHLPAARVETGAPLEPDDIRYGPPRAVTHILWQGADVMVCLRMCSCTTVNVAETALLIGVPFVMGASLQLDASPPRLTAVHWQIHQTSSADHAFPLLAPMVALVAVFSPRWVLALGLFWAGTSMVQQSGDTRVQEVPLAGAFPWHEDYHQRTLRPLSASNTFRLRLRTPFADAGDVHEVSCSCEWGWLVGLLLKDEPPWARSVLPIWPNPSSSILELVAVPPDTGSACILIVSETWQICLLLPRRARLDWYADAIAARTPGAFGQLYPPVAIEPTISQTEQADSLERLSPTLSLRSGDVFYASPLGHIRTGRRGGVVHIHSVSALRHCTLWQRFLHVIPSWECILWSPGCQPQVMTVPAGAEWLPHLGAFDAFLSAGIQGRWIPSPWAWGQQVHMVAACSLPHRVHILVRGEGQTECLVAPAIADVGFITHVFRRQAPEGPWTLAGHPDVLYHSEATMQVDLRDADVIRPGRAHKPLPSRPRSTALRVAPPRLLLLLALGTKCKLGGPLLLLAWFNIHTALSMETEFEVSSSSSTSACPRVASRSRSRRLASSSNRLEPRVLAVGQSCYPVNPSLRSVGNTVGLASFPWVQALCPIQGPATPFRTHTHMSDVHVFSTMQYDLLDWGACHAPVWPAISMGAMHLVPCPPKPLVCVAVSVGGTVHARLMLRDTPWRLFPRSLGEDMEYLAPCGSGATQVGASVPKLRHGDMIIARPPAAARVPGPMPICLTAEQARHHAVWQLPFLLTQRDQVTLWRPDRPKQVVPLPAGASWRPTAASFITEWSGQHARWAPVPWIPDAGLHLCLRCDEANRVNVVVWDRSPVCRQLARSPPLTHVVRGTANMDPSDVLLRNGDVLIPRASVGRSPSPASLAFASDPFGVPWLLPWRSGSPLPPSIPLGLPLFPQRFG